MGNRITDLRRALRDIMADAGGEPRRGDRESVRTWKRVRSVQGTTNGVALAEALADLMDSEGGEPRDDKKSVAAWARARAALRRVNPRCRNTDDTFGDVIYGYSRKQALEDGQLVDMTEWGSAAKGFHGGFTTPVAMTASVWAEVDRKPMPRLQDVRGRAHDVLWMASLAVRSGLRSGRIGDGGGRVPFQVIMQVGRQKKHTYYVDLSGGDDGEPVVTIGKAEDF